MAVPFFFRIIGVTLTNLNCTPMLLVPFVAIFGRNWCYGEWPDSWPHRNIFRVLSSCAQFAPMGHEMRNSRILFSTDNEV